MIDVDREKKTIKFRKVGLEGDNRRSVNDLRIISDDEYIGIEDKNTIVIYNKGENLTFKPSYEKLRMEMGEKNKIKFELKNNINTGIEILSYKFYCIFNGSRFSEYEKHEWKQYLAAGESQSHAFGEIDVIQHYFRGRKDLGKGVYDSEIHLEYRIDASSDVKTKIRFARLIVSAA